MFKQSGYSVHNLRRLAVISVGTVVICLASLQTAFAQGSTLTQSDYRWYQNRNNASPNTALAAQNTAVTNVANYQVIRLRMNVLVTTQNMAASSEQFKLQYSASVSGPWVDVGAIGSNEMWRGYDNSDPADGGTLGSNDKKLSNSDVAESYEEENPSTTNPRAVNVNQRGEWDWVLQNNYANGSTAYYFRMAMADGAQLAGYTRYPQVTTADAPTLTQDVYRWYQNRNNKDPITPLTSENAALSSSITNTVYHLRVNVGVTGTNLLAGTRDFKLQYATNVSGPWTDVGSIDSSTIWRGYNNGSPADGVAALALLLTGSSVSGTYEEQNPSALNPNRVNVGQRAEWGWVIQHNGADSGATYYFRMVMNNGTALNTYNRYPTLYTPGSTVSSNSSSGNPETVVIYTNTVTNAGGVADVFDITTSSSAGWPVALYQANGSTPLVDNDGDMIPDTGSLSSGQSVNIVVKITVGWNTISDTTTITSTSSLDTLASDIGANTTTAPPTITVIVSDGTAQFGTSISPQGDDSDSPDAVSDYQGAVGNQGSYYVWKSSGGTGVGLTVKSNRTWNGTVGATENTGTSPTMTIASGVLRYATTQPVTYAACASSTAFTTTSVTWQSNVGPGITAYTYFYCLRVDWDDDPGIFQSTVAYSVSQ